MSENWRFLDTEDNDGNFNMAFDEALLNLISQNKTPVLRFFTWKPYAVSLGNGQKITSINKQKVLAEGFEIVRRPTGGRAIFHAEELTYSIILPNEHELAKSGITETYNKISIALLNGLKNCGLTSAEFEKSQIDFANFYKTENSFPCFSASARYEIVVNGKKIIGSAQKKTSFGVLQHGTILIGKAHSKLVDFLNVSEAARQKIKVEFLQKTTEISTELGFVPKLSGVKKAFLDGFSEAFCVTFVESKPFENELAETEKLLQTKIKELEN
ncbi:lipoate--protein ligase family protein [bacterium]|nr:lipoate--protein ligase family protein [bacterium]